MITFSQGQATEFGRVALYHNKSQSRDNAKTAQLSAVTSWHHLVKRENSA